MNLESTACPPSQRRDLDCGTEHANLRLTMTRIVAVIPARMGSTRFPGKPLAPILGRPMIEHIYHRARQCSRLEGVFVATCDNEIKSAVEAFGGSVIMTSSSHDRASDRVAEAAKHLAADIIVMIQGDEPMIMPEMIEAALDPMLNDTSVSCVNLIRRVTSEEEYKDPNTIKVVAALNADALYFSRSAIPAMNLLAERAPVFKQVCVIPFRRSLLHEFSRLPQSPLERAESIDMLRLIEHGYRVRLVETDVNSHAVDTPGDLNLVERLMRGAPFDGMI